MSLVLNEYTGDGVTTTFNFSMVGGYLSREFVVFLTRPNDKLLEYSPYTGTVTWLSDFSVRVRDPIPVGTTFVITRRTASDALVDFQNTSRITERNLDTAFGQSLHRTAELEDVTARRVEASARLAEDAVAAAQDAAEAAEVVAAYAATTTSLVGAANAAAAASAASASEAASNAVAATDTADEALALIQQAVKGNVDSFNGRDGAVLPQQGDYTPDMVGFESSGVLTPVADFSPVPAWSNHMLNTQAQAVANRTELLRDNQRRSPLHFATYAEASAAATTLPDGQVVVSDADEVMGVVSGGVITSEQSVYKVADYAKIRSYTGRGTRLRVADPTGAHWWVRASSGADNGGTVLTGASGTVWKREDTSHVTVAMFGARPLDGTLPLHDSGEALQRAFDWSRSTGLPIFVDELYYTGRKLNAGGAIIRSTLGVPGDANFRFLARRDGSYVFGSATYTWFYNTDHLDYTWAQAINDVAYGPAICSDINETFIWCENGHRFDIDGVAFFGDKNKPLQDGLGTAEPDAYTGTSQRIGKIRVKGCGRHGVSLLRGFEVSQVRDWECSDNNGHGLYVGRKAGVDSATEYLYFHGGSFTYNRLDGVFFEHVRKAVYFHNVDIGGNGQYNSPRGIDPVLGYNRNIPALRKDMKAGVRVNDCSLDIGAGTLFGFGLEECFGEMVAVGLHLRGQNGGGITRDIKLKDNQFLRADSWPSSGVENGAAFHFNVKWAADWYFGGNYSQSLDYWSFEQIPTSEDGSIVFDDYISTSALSSPEGRFLAGRRYPVLHSATTVKASGSVLAKSIGGLSTNGPITMDLSGIGLVAPANDQSSFTVALSVTATFQSEANRSIGAYILLVNRLVGSNGLALVSFAGSSTSGFTAAPTITPEGILTIPAQAYYRYTVERLDMAPI